MSCDVRTMLKPSGGNRLKDMGMIPCRSLQRFDFQADVAARYAINLIFTCHLCHKAEVIQGSQDHNFQKCGQSSR